MCACAVITGRRAELFIRLHHMKNLALRSLQASLERTKLYKQGRAHPHGCTVNLHTRGRTLLLFTDDLLWPGQQELFLKVIIFLTCKRINTRAFRRREYNRHTYCGIAVMPQQFEGLWKYGVMHKQHENKHILQFRLNLQILFKKYNKVIYFWLCVTFVYYFIIL